MYIWVAHAEESSTYSQHSTKRILYLACGSPKHAIYTYIQLLWLVIRRAQRVGSVLAVGCINFIKLNLLLSTVSQALVNRLKLYEPAVKADWKFVVTIASTF